MQETLTESWRDTDLCRNDIFANFKILPQCKKTKIFQSKYQMLISYQRFQMTTAHFNISLISKCVHILLARAPC